MNIGNPSSFQTTNKILVSCIAAYKGRSVPTGVQELIKSCKKFNIQLSIFGTDVCFTTMWNIKFVLLESYLKQTESDWILNVDASDVLFIRDLEYIFSQRNEDKVIWAAERNCYPIESLKEKYPACHNSYRFLNGGGFFGKRDLVLKCFDCKPLNHCDCDQGGHSQNYLSGNLPMILDHNCNIFNTLWGHSDEDFDIQEGFLYNKETKTNPAILHANGSTNGLPIFRKFIV